MIVLGLDTTTKSGGIALRKEDGQENAYVGDSSLTHSERLPGEIIQFLEGNGVELSEVDRFAVLSGPGSFTGLRVGLATIQALALTNKKDVVAVPTLEAIAYAGIDCVKSLDTKTFLIPWMNAFRGEIFTAVYERQRIASADSSDSSVIRINEVEAPRVGLPKIMLREWGERLNSSDCRIVFLSVNPQDSSMNLTQYFGTDATWSIGEPNLALTVARIGAEIIGKVQPIKPSVVRPVYIRRPDAVLARERRQAIHSGAK